jgi:ACR3 family arsenite efflux pump ArsB
LVGVAVKVTVVPVHTGLALAAMETLAVTVGFTVIVMMLLVAGLPVTHVALDVITTFTASLWTGI